MAKLICKNKTILSEMRYLKSVFQISIGLMFASKNKIRKGVCLVIPRRKDSRFNCSVTMLFVFSSLEILFVNSDMEIVDKVVLKPFKISYTPKRACKYVIESEVGRFKDLRVRDKVKFML